MLDDRIRNIQHKRVVVLSALAIVFGLYAVYQLAGIAFSGSQVRASGVKGNEIFLLSVCVLIICSVVTIAIQSFQDEQKSRYLSLHDVLTNLPNRKNLTRKIKRKATADNKPATLLLLNIRRLAKLNNSYGRNVGDDVLKVCAERLRFLFDTPNFVGVVNPGVFGVYVEGISNKANLEMLSEQITKALKLPIKLKEQTFYVDTSIGAVLVSGNAISAENILLRAEMALVEAQSSVAGHPIIFNAGIQNLIEERGALEAELRDALEKEELETYFQPLIAEDGKTLLGFEALARWEHPTRGMISPSCFVPLAQSLNLTDVLGRQIMAKACQQIRPLDNLKICVNVTPDHFIQPDYVNQIRKLLEQTGVSPDRLELEITETELLLETELAADRIVELRKLGVRVALDDFGTGYSGLSYINKLDVDRIKIDASFVQDIETSESSRSMIGTIMTIAKDRGFKVTAEGVETKAQFEFLKQFDDVTFQGYLFSVPLHYRDLMNSEFLQQHDEQKFNAEMMDDTASEDLSPTG